MSVELEGTSSTRKIGKLPKFTAKLTGDFEGIECVLTLKAEYERQITDILPLVSGKDFIIKLIDPQMKLDEFQLKEPVIFEEFILGFPVEEIYVEGQCSACGLEMWVGPGVMEPICVACKKELTAEIFRKENKEWVKQKRIKTTSETKDDLFIYRLPDETLEEYDERKQLIEEKQFRAERIARAEAQA